MAKKAKIELPVAPLPDLVRWWQKQETPAVVIGGLAVSLLARPRVTRDIDGLVLLPEEHWRAFLKTGEEFGILSRDTDVLEFARTSKVFLLRHQASGIDIDIILAGLPFEEEVIARANVKQIAGVPVPLASVEDLLIMKAVAHRDRDFLDIDGLLAAHPRLDLVRVRRWVQAFADILEAPDLVADLEKRLAHHKPGKRRKKGD